MFYINIYAIKTGELIIKICACARLCLFKRRIPLYKYASFPIKLHFLFVTNIVEMQRILILFQSMLKFYLNIYIYISFVINGPIVKQSCEGTFILININIKNMYIIYL